MWERINCVLTTAMRATMAHSNLDLHCPMVGFPVAPIEKTKKPNTPVMKESVDELSTELARKDGLLSPIKTPWLLR